MNQFVFVEDFVNNENRMCVDMVILLVGSLATNISDRLVREVLFFRMA